MRIQFYQDASLEVKQPALLFSGPAAAGPIGFIPYTTNEEGFRLRVTSDTIGSVIVGSETLVFTYPHAKTTIKMLTQLDHVTVANDIGHLDIEAIDMVGDTISQVILKPIKVQYDTRVSQASDGASSVTAQFMTQDKTIAPSMKIIFKGVTHIIKSVEPFLWFNGKEIYRILYA
jgi:hypothetical protein